MSGLIVFCITYAVLVERYHADPYAALGVGFIAGCVAMWLYEKARWLVR